MRRLLQRYMRTPAGSQTLRFLEEVPLLTAFALMILATRILLEPMIPTDFPQIKIALWLLTWIAYLLAVAKIVKLGVKDLLGAGTA